jgi:MORN repeat variant
MEADIMAHLEQLRYNKIVLFFGIALITSCTAVTVKQQQPVLLLRLNAADTALTSVNGIVYFRNNLFSGTLFSLYKGTADTASLSSYLHGKEHGAWSKYYPGGKLKEQREFDNGKKTGAHITWWPSGNMQTYCLLKNDEYEGCSKEWTDKGVLVKEMNYHNGQEEGWQRWWHDNGKVRSNYIIKKGRRYGLLGTKHCINVSDSIFKN